MSYEYRHQPLRGLYLFYQLGSVLLIRLPFWTLTNLLRGLRPRPSWDLGRALRVKFYRHMMFVGSKVGALSKAPTHLAIAPGVNVKGVWVDPVPELVVGEVKGWAEAAEVEYVRLPGYWLDKTGSDIAPGAPPIPGEKVVYALHGGAYISLSANPTDPTANIARGLITYCAPVRRAFSIEYRLSKGAPYDPAHAFPTALVDALAGYHYLVRTVGFAPEDIILEGDSAGGNLALALTRYLVENQPLIDAPPAIPRAPGALLLMSPWADLSAAHLGPGSSCYSNADSDYLGMERRAPGTPSYPVLAFLGPHAPAFAQANRYVSPASPEVAPRTEGEGLFTGFPPTFVVAGGAEQLLDSIRALAERMYGELGDKVVYYEAPDGIHDYTVFLWHEPERTETMVKIGEWVDTL